MDEDPEVPKAKILLAPENTNIQVAPGSKKAIKLTIISQKDSEDLFELSVNGVPIEWVSLDKRVVQLKAGERAEFELTITVPESPDIRPGRYSFSVQATSQSDRAIEATVTGELTVAVYQSQGRIGIMLSQVNFSVTPGNRIVIPILLENRGLVADAFRMEVKGIPAPWITLPDGLTHLDPGEQKEIEFSVLPPRSPESTAGRMQFTINISSQAAPNQPEMVKCGLTVASYFAFSSHLMPQTVAPGEPALIRVQNEGNLPDVFSLEWLSEGNTLKFENVKRETVASASGGGPQTRISYTEITAPEVLRLPPGKIGSVEFRTSPRRPPIFGGEFSYPFSFRIQSSSSKRVVTQNGAVLGKAFIPLWMPVVLGILLLAVICVGAFATLNNLNQASRATQGAQTGIAEVLGATSTAGFLQTQVAMGTQTGLIPVTGLTDTPTSTIPATPTAQPSQTNAPSATVQVAPTPTTAPSATVAPPPPTATATAQPPTPTSAVTSIPTMTATSPIPALSGTIVFQSNRDGNLGLYVMNAATMGITRLTQDLTPDSQPALAPNGVSVAYVGVQGNNNDIFLTGLNHPTPVDLTNNASDDQQPTWSADGQFIAFTTNRDGNNEIYAMRADGSQPHNITNDPADDSSPSWFQTGSFLFKQDWIAFTSNRDGNEEIYIMKPDGSSLRRLTNNPANDYSPAGSSNMITFVSERDGNPEIYAMNLDGTVQTDLTNNPAPDYKPVISPDGQWIAFTSERDGNAEIYVMRKDGTNAFNLTKNPAQDSYPVWR